MQPDPPASRNPAPMLKLVPRLASHPPAHTQCAKRGYVHAASRAVDAAHALSLQRSAPAPRAMDAARLTLMICSSAVGPAGEASKRTLRRKAVPEASQPQGLPARTTTS